MEVAGAACPGLSPRNSALDPPSRPRLASRRLRYTVAEHSRVVERFVTQLGLEGITLMVQDWGGPIGFSVAVRHPQRFRAFVIGNTFGWPVEGRRASSGSPAPGKLLS